MEYDNEEFADESIKAAKSMVDDINDGIDMEFDIPMVEVNVRPHDEFVGQFRFRDIDE